MFYKYALAEGNYGQNVESKVEVADLTVYLLLFYLSELNGYKYSIESSIKTLTDILETNPQVVERALDSLEEADLIHYHAHGDHLHITIIPINTD